MSTMKGDYVQDDFLGDMERRDVPNSVPRIVQGVCALCGQEIFQKQVSLPEGSGREIMENAVGIPVIVAAIRNHVAEHGDAKHIKHLLEKKHFAARGMIELKSVNPNK